MTADAACSGKTTAGVAGAAAAGTAVDDILLDRSSRVVRRDLPILVGRTRPATKDGLPRVLEVHLAFPRGPQVASLVGFVEHCDYASTATHRLVANASFVFQSPNFGGYIVLRDVATGGIVGIVLEQILGETSRNKSEAHRLRRSNSYTACSERQIRGF